MIQPARRIVALTNKAPRGEGKAMRRILLPSLLAVMVVVSAAAVSGQSPGQRFVTYGADLPPAQRAEVAQIFGIDPQAPAETVTTPEMVAALQGTGLPAAPTDRSISSSSLTCLNQGEGMTVRTQNITRISAPIYANALITAGVGDGNIVIAAPPSNPVTGETALVGVLKAFPQCQAGRQPEQARINLAYQQIARTVALAGPNGNLEAASTVMLRVAQPVITGQTRDDDSIGAALDAAVAGEGIQLTPQQRAEWIPFLRSLSGLDYGAYARGYQIQQVSPNEVRVVPAGGPARPAATAAAAPGAAATQAAPAPSGASGAAATQAAAAPNVATGATFTGEVARTGDQLVVRADGLDRTVNPAANVIVTRDGNPATVADIQRDDSVRVTTGADGAAQRIDATSSGDDGLAWWQWLLPLLALVALAGLVFWLLAKRRRDSFILEPKEPETTARRR